VILTLFGGENMTVIMDDSQQCKNYYQHLKGIRKFGNDGAWSVEDMAYTRLEVFNTVAIMAGKARTVGGLVTGYSGISRANKRFVIVWIWNVVKGLPGKSQNKLAKKISRETFFSVSQSRVSRILSGDLTLSDKELMVWLTIITQWIKE
jgi:hypothetical protein